MHRCDSQLERVSLEQWCIKLMIINDQDIPFESAEGLLREDSLEDIFELFAQQYFTSISTLNIPT
jgi:hypothetical protein